MVDMVLLISCLLLYVSEAVASSAKEGHLIDYTMWYW